MWVKRTEAEVAKAKTDANRIRLRWAVVAGAFSWLNCTFLHGKGWRSRYTSVFVSLEEVPMRMLEFLPVGVFLGWLVYRFRTKPRQVMVCPNCEATKDEDSVLACSCGGHFEYLETMKWI
jgi:hypothetical protein